MFRGRGKVDMLQHKYGHLRVVVRELPSVLLARARQAAREAGRGGEGDAGVDRRTMELVQKTRWRMRNARRTKYK